MNTTLRRNAELSLLIFAALIAAGGYWLASLGLDVKPTDLARNAGVFAVVCAAGHLATRKWAPSASPIFLPIALTLSAVGFGLIHRLSALTTSNLADAQLRWIAFGVLGYILTLVLVKEVRSIARFRYTFMAAGVALLLLPMLPGIGREVNGARLWIRIGPLNFQPAELGKVALVVFFAAYLSERRELLTVARRRFGIGIPRGKHFGPVLAAWGVSLLVMINQKDLGSSLLFFGIFLAMLWMATARHIYLLSGVGMFAVGALIAVKIFKHVSDRIDVWQEPFKYLDGAGYQVTQSLFAMATGGIWGTGLGLGRPDLIRFSVHTDFIFSAVGEELGFIGAAAVLVAYGLYSASGFGLATRAGDDFSKLLTAGITLATTFQTALIIGGVTRLIPLTGVTLPFMSYGGSSLLSNFLLTALLVRISDQTDSHPVISDSTEINSPAGGAR